MSYNRDWSRFQGYNRGVIIDSYVAVHSFLAAGYYFVDGCYKFPVPHSSAGGPAIRGQDLVLINSD